MILNKEFIGLEKVIDTLIDSIRPFYIFPKALKRPLVVNLFGMTATGKTRLIERLIEILELKHKYVRFDIGEYTNNNSDIRIKHDFSRDLCRRNDNNLVIVFDEIQMGRTINEKGEEIDRSSLRPIWELIDSGKLTITSNLNMNFLSHLELIRKIDFVNDLDSDFNAIDLEKSRMIYETLMSYGYLYPLTTSDIKSMPLVNLLNKSDKKYLETNYPESIIGDVLYTEKLKENNINFKLTFSEFNFDGLAVFNYNFFNKLKITCKNFNYTYNSFIEYLKSLQDKDKILDFLYEVILNDNEPSQTFDFSKSLIFCIGNIDEAYMMSHTSNPDADADIFYEHSLKISIPKMKDALSYRFRMEQIGRLGNNIIIYPSFSKESYFKIIDKILIERIDSFKKEFSIDLKFTDYLKEIFYKESVFPSQGVRPLLTTAITFIDSYVSKIIGDIVIKNFNVEKIEWDFDYNSSSHVIKSFYIENDTTYEEVFTYNVILNIESLRKTDFSQLQTFVAIHESGHALVSIIKAKLIPKLVSSKTASNAEGFCRVEHPDIQTKTVLYNQILISLGGRAAEKYVLKDSDMLSNGSFSDLSHATILANNFYKIYGFGNNPFCIKHNSNPTSAFFGNKLQENVEEEAYKLLMNAEEEVDKVMEENKDLLIDMIDYLSNNSQLTYEQIEEMVSKYGLEIKDHENYFDIKTLLSDFKK